MSIDAPTRIVVLLAVLLACGAAAVALLVVGHSRSTPHAAPAAAKVATHRASTITHRAATTPAKPAKPTLLPGLPKPIAYALARHPVVVVGLYEHRTGDSTALAEARAGAALAHTTFISLDVLLPRYAGSIADFTGSLAEPGIVVVRRPGRIVSRLDGYQDRQVVFQAAHDAR